MTLSDLVTPEELRAFLEKRRSFRMDVESIDPGLMKRAKRLQQHLRVIAEEVRNEPVEVIGKYLTMFVVIDELLEEVTKNVQ